MPLLSLSSLRLLRPPAVYPTYTTNAAYVSMRPMKSVFSKLPLHACSFHLFYIWGKATTWIPKNLPKELNDPTWHARDLTLHGAVLAKKWQEQTGQINIVSLSPPPSACLKMSSVTKCRHRPNRKGLSPAPCDEVTGAVMLHLACLPGLPGIASLSSNSHCPTKPFSEALLSLS